MPRDFSYMEGNAVCVQLAPPHSYAPLASLAETGRRSQHLSSLIKANISVVLSRTWAGLSPAWLHPRISRYRDKLAYDIAIAMQFFLTIRALLSNYTTNLPHKSNLTLSQVTMTRHTHEISVAYQTHLALEFNINGGTSHNTEIRQKNIVKSYQPAQYRDTPAHFLICK